MPFDVFISYGSEDKQVADAVCSRLEQRSIRCWMAPRDILPGTSWPEAIPKAIEQSKVMVVVVSGHSLASKHVPREVLLACQQGKTVVPFQIEKVDLTGELKYWLSNAHWLDAVSPPLEHNILVLAADVQALIHRSPSIAALVPSPSPQLFSWRWAWGIGFAGAIIPVMFFIAHLSGKKTEPFSGPRDPNPKPLTELSGQKTGTISETPTPPGDPNLKSFSERLRLLRDGDLSGIAGEVTRLAKGLEELERLATQSGRNSIESVTVEFQKLKMQFDEVDRLILQRTRLRGTLGAAEQLEKQARSLNAPRFAPKSFTEASKALNEAVQQLERGDFGSGNQDVDKATNALQLSVQRSRSIQSVNNTVITLVVDVANAEKISNARNPSLNKALEVLSELLRQEFDYSASSEERNSWFHGADTKVEVGPLEANGHRSMVVSVTVGDSISKLFGKNPTATD